MPVGLVVGTEDATPLQFSVALAPDAYLQLDDVVVTGRPVPGLGSVATFGVVTQVRARHEGASFGSDVFLIADGVRRDPHDGRRAMLSVVGARLCPFHPRQTWHR